MISLAKGYLAMTHTGWISLMIYLVGGFDTLFKALLIMMALDYLTGLIKGYKKKNINSKTAYKGFLKKIVALMVVMWARQMDIVFHHVGVQTLEASSQLSSIVKNIDIRTLVLLFYVSTESLSIIENAAALGVPIPEKLKSALEQCRDNKKAEEI